MAQYKHLPIYKTTYDLLEYLRRTTIKNLYKRADQLNDFKSLQASVNSYFGFMRHANLYNERKKAAIHLSQRGCWFNGKLTKLKGMYPCTSV